jgi:mRNA-degrading endonuclease toxin of MazEF toxin-antitoxin module
MSVDEFDKWNKVKKEIAFKDTYLTFKVREIYWLKIGQNIGYETGGKGRDFLRPVLIFRKFSKSTFLGIPLTTSLKNDMFHYPFKYKEHKESCASLSQIKLFDTKRINQKDGKMSVEDFNGLKVKLKELMDL